MLYFIPSWYADGAWNEREQAWYKRREHVEFDDIVKHVQLFHRKNLAPYTLMLLSYTPNFRHFLHRNSIYLASYWSCFDAIQGVTVRRMQPFSYRHLQWPDQVEFIYSMFAVLAMHNGERYAKVEFGEDGNPFEVILYHSNAVIRKDVYDDRGFLSSRIYYEHGKPSYQEYLNQTETWVMRRFWEDGHLEINPDVEGYVLQHAGVTQIHPFGALRYDGLEQLLGEVLRAYLSHTTGEDAFCVAAHSLHMGLLQEVLADRNVILSLFEERHKLDLLTSQSFQGVRHLICDSQEGRAKLRERWPDLPPCTVITPFDTRPDFGISQQIAVKKILVPVDGLDASMFAFVVEQLAQYMAVWTDTRVCFFTRDSIYNRKQVLMSQASAVLSQEIVDECFSVEQCVDEFSTSRCMREQRLMVDFRPMQDIYLRVQGISSGIPQILLYPSEFVRSGENGVILDDKSQLLEAVVYYLEDLSHWNHAMVCAYEMSREFDTNQQIQSWREVLDHIARNSDTSGQ